MSADPSDDDIEQDNLRDLLRDSLAAAESLAQDEDSVSLTNISEAAVTACKAPRSTFPLPSELRILIYELLLEAATPSHCQECNKEIAEHRGKRPSALSVMFSVSHQMRVESLSIFYTHQPQSFHSSNSMIKHLDRLSSERLDCIQCISLICRGTCAKEAFELLGRCRGLKTCKLYFLYGFIPARETLYEIRGIRDVKIGIVPLGEREKVELVEHSRRFVEEMEDIRDAMMRPIN